MQIETFIKRQQKIREGCACPLPLPKFPIYTICSLRGGTGKTTLAFNLGCHANSLLLVDTSPQANLTLLFDNNYSRDGKYTVYDMILPHLVANAESPSDILQKAEKTNTFFAGKKIFYIPSDMRLGLLPTQMMTAIGQAEISKEKYRNKIIDSVLYSLRSEIKSRIGSSGKCLIDTSPFLSGATHLALHACDAILLPVRTDMQSVNSFKLLLRMLNDPASEFQRISTSDKHIPKIQMVVLTHYQESDNQMIMYIVEILDIIEENIACFTTKNPIHHLAVLDDFEDLGESIHFFTKKSAKINNQIKYIYDSIF